jgi:hypothetical protein
MKNKKAQIEIMYLFLIMGVLLVVAFIGAIVIAITHWGTQTLAPIASDLGMIDNFNASQAGNITFGTLNTIVGLLPMIVGFGYLMLLIGCIALVMSYRGTQNPIFIALFFGMMILMIFIAIFASNAYQDLYEGTDEIAVELQSMTMLSYLILYSPYVFGLIGMICGIFLFSGRQNEQYGVNAGY